MHNRKLGRGIAGALAALILTAGAALALETLSVAVPSGDSFTATAVIRAGDGGATVFSERPVEEEGKSTEFSVVFDENSETFSINGGVGMPYVPGQEYTVVAEGRRILGAWLVDVTVYDAMGLPIGLELGIEMADAPTYVTATAADVIDLDCE
jgi:hypothetical protein